MNPRYFLEGVDPKSGRRGVAMQARMRDYAIFRIPSGSKPWTAVMSADGLGHLHFCRSGILPGNITRAWVGSQLS